MAFTFNPTNCNLEYHKRHNMKKLAFLTLAMLAGCSGNNIAPEQHYNETQMFTATMEKNEGSTRVHLEELVPNWQTGDRISIDGHEYVAASDGTRVDFYGTGAIENVHHAYYPATLYDNGNPVLPAVQPFTPERFDMPMYAASETEELHFKNLCTVLAIKITNADIARVKSIKVTSDKAMCGAFTVQADKAVLINSTPTAETRAVVMECAEAVELDDAGIIFHIAIPAQKYEYLNIYISADGQVYNELMATVKRDGIGETARNRIFSIDYERNAVRLYENGPYWATKYWGADSEMDYGGYVAWEFNFGRFSSSNWSAPELDDVYNLISTCDYSDFEFRGKTAPYSDYHIHVAPGGYKPLSFDPHEQGTKAYFWTKTIYSSGLDLYIWCFTANKDRADTAWLTADSDYYHDGDKCALRMLIR